MKIDFFTLQSEDPDIFTCGDAARGPKTVIEAIADGRQAAISIDRYLSGQNLRLARDGQLKTIKEPQNGKYDRAARAQMPYLEPKKRVKNFNEVQKGLAKAVTVQEADAGRGPARPERPLPRRRQGSRRRAGRAGAGVVGEGEGVAASAPDRRRPASATPGGRGGQPGTRSDTLVAMGVAPLHRYELLELIGAGGSAAVHRARERRTGEVVALKILRGVGAVDARQLEREAAVLSRLRHEHVVRYVEHGRTADGELFLAMQWIDGESLSARLQRHRLTIAEIVPLIRNIVAALGRPSPFQTP